MNFASPMETYIGKDWASQFIQLVTFFRDRICKIETNGIVDMIVK